MAGAAGAPCARAAVPPVSDLSHVDEAGAVRMVDVGDKPAVRRWAVARAFVRMAPETVARLGELPKGDALTTAQLAGIMAAKRTSELIPLCHPLPLSHAGVELRVADDGVEIVASAETTAQTGVEMEALTAASVAALTVYDMVKGVERGVEIRSVHLVSKSGGQSGEWRRPADGPGSGGPGGPGGPGDGPRQRRPGERIAGRIRKKP